MLYRVLALIWKELQAQFRDRNSRRLLIMPLIVQTALFPFAATLEVTNNTVAIYNQDTGPYSIELMQRLAKAKSFTHLKIIHGINEVQDAIDNQKALLAITFPSNFSRTIDSNKPATLQAIFDGRRSNSAQIAASYLQTIVNDYSQELSLVNPQHSLVSVRNWFNPNLEYQWFILPSLIAIITTIGCMIVTALSVAREREQGTFEQLLVSPLTPGSIMIGKAIPAILIALFQASIILLAGILFYRIPFEGSLVLLYVGLLFYALSLAGIGLFISSICTTQQQAFLGVFSFLMPAILLSGYVSPIENIPQPLQSLTWINPVRHFVVIAKGIYLKGLDFSMVWHDLWPLLIIAFITLSLAYVRFNYFLK